MAIQKDSLNSDAMNSLVVTLVEEEGNWPKTVKRFVPEYDAKAIEKFKGWAYHQAAKLKGLDIPAEAKSAVAEYEKQKKLSEKNRADKAAAFEAAGGRARFDAEPGDPLK